jgi:hypothetical protein
MRVLYSTSSSLLKLWTLGLRGGPIAVDIQLFGLAKHQAAEKKSVQWS